MSALDPINDPENEDYSEVACCHWCRRLIEPGAEQHHNGWEWHTDCLPMHVIYGREDEQRAAERAGK